MRSVLCAGAPVASPSSPSWPLFPRTQPLVAGNAMTNSSPPASRKLAFVGNHLPRQCGIATFTTDLSESVALAAPDMRPLVVAMNDTGQNHAYPEQVRFEIAEDDLAAYRRAAQYLNASGVEVVSLQHEYGIF